VVLAKVRSSVARAAQLPLTLQTKIINSLVDDTDTRNTVRPKERLQSAVRMGNSSFVVRLGMRSSRLSVHDEAGRALWLVQGPSTPVAAVHRQYCAQHVFTDPISQAV
jgi:hypothetical protein